MAEAAKTNDVRQAPAGDAADLITKAELARRLGVTRGRVTQLTADGGKYAEAMRGKKVSWSAVQHLDAVRGDAAKTPKTSSPEGAAPDPAFDRAVASDRQFKDARARKMEADADTAEATRLERIGKLVSRAAIRPKLFSELRGLREQILKVPDDVAEQIASMSDVREIRTVLMDALRGVLTGYVENLKARGPDGDGHA